jgi:hypothetical protein
VSSLQPVLLLEWSIVRVGGQSDSGTTAGVLIGSAESRIHDPYVNHDRHGLNETQWPAMEDLDELLALSAVCSWLQRDDFVGLARWLWNQIPGMRAKEQVCEVSD